MSTRYWEPDLSQGNIGTEDERIISTLLAYIANKEYEADKFEWFLKEAKPYAKFDLDSMKPVILEHKIEQ